MRKGLAAALGVVGAILLIALIGEGYLRYKYNEFVTADESIKARWAQVQNQLKRRADLIPNLVESVKGYAAHERKVLEAITNARVRLARAGNTKEEMEGANELSSALARLLVIAEKYPTLKADATFIRLMDELAGTENRLAVERMRYNETVQQYNTEVRRFPSSLVASLFGFEEQPFFQAPAAAMEFPKVMF